MSKRVLKKVASNKLTPLEAYNILYQPRPNRGNYIKLRMKIKESLGLSRFVNALFFFPIPIWLARGVIIRQLKKNDLPIEIYNIVRKYSGGTSILVNNDEIKLKIIVI